MIDLVPKVPYRVVFDNEQAVKDAVTHVMNKMPQWCVLETHNINRVFPATATLKYDFEQKSLTIDY